MDNEDLDRHLEYMDGVLLAQSLVLAAMLKHDPKAAHSLKAHVSRLSVELEHIALPPEKRRGLTNTLEKIVGR